jgi:hypothetical protein
MLYQLIILYNASKSQVPLGSRFIHSSTSRTHLSKADKKAKQKCDRGRRGKTMAQKGTNLSHFSLKIIGQELYTSVASKKFIE